MFSNNAYCFCPEVISRKIADAQFYYDLISPCTVHSTHHVMLDSDGELWLEYLTRAENDPEAYSNLEMWKKAMNYYEGKIINVRNMEKYTEIDYKFLSELAIKATATCKKFIVTASNDDYESSIDILKGNGVELLSTFNLIESSNSRFSYNEYRPAYFFEDLLFCLSKVAGTRANKLENEHNDYLRDLLEAKNYDVHDQHRMGYSATWKSIGNLDVIIKSRGYLATILEPLRLSSIESDNIKLHYGKLVNNYNPQGLQTTHLIVYYIGEATSYNDFCKRYLIFIEALCGSDFEFDINFNSISNVETQYQNIQSFVQQGEINGNSFRCYHTCINFI